MTTYARSEDTLTLIVQSADPADLEQRINAAIAVLGAEDVPPFITGISLAGGGDGHTFVVMVDYVDPTDVAAGNAFPTALSATLVRCYMASDAQELAAARSLTTVPSPVDGASYLLVDDQIQGASKGTRFMGLIVYGLGVVPEGAFAPTALARMTTPQALTGATPLVLAFDTLTGSDKFALTGANKAVTYSGPQGFNVALSGSISVEQTVAASLILVEIVRDPLGTPVVVGSMTMTLLTALSTENLSVYGLSTVQPVAVDPTFGSLGLRVTGAAGGGTVQSAALMVTPV